jgi:hypothetical protein
MRHPDLEQVIEVAESAVPFHASAGWQVVPDEPPAASPVDKKPKAPARRTDKESD